MVPTLACANWGIWAEEVRASDLSVAKLHVDPATDRDMWHLYRCSTSTHCRKSKLFQYQLLPWRPMYLLKSVNSSFILHFWSHAFPLLFSKFCLAILSLLFFKCFVVFIPLFTFTEFIFTVHSTLLKAFAVLEWMWQPEVNIEYLPQSLSTLFFETRSATESVSHGIN